MINFFDTLYTSIDNKFILLNKFRYYSVLRFIVRFTANIILPIYFNLSCKNDRYAIQSSNKTNHRIIVSLTSFPVRINKLWLVIESLLRQTQKPDKLILWLSKDQFPNLNYLPHKLVKQCKRGLDIRLVDGDIRSHKKYYYTLQEFPNDYLLTVDDDIFYRTTMIEDLHNYSIRYPTAVISQYSVEMSWKGYKLDEYKLWKNINKEKEPNFNTFFGSGGGTLFPPNSMHSEVLNLDLFMKLTPTADDVWLNAMCRLNKTKIAVTKYYSTYIPVLNVSDVKLASVNNLLNQNDIQIFALQEYFLKKKGLDPFMNLSINKKQKK